MSKSIIEIVPIRAALPRGANTEMDVLVRIQVPAGEVDNKRPPLNLGLVIDRSGSMQGEKLEDAKRAAVFAIEQLSATDRVSITVFNNTVETIAPSAMARDKTRLVRAIDSIYCGGSTALHDAWVEGGLQVSQHLAPNHLNRVLLLTDGMANHGETNAERICGNVHGLAQRGISTSTLGVGREYNEDLLEAMAESGQGNYYFIQNSSQLSRIFSTELHGLMATLGQKVSLGLEPCPGVEVEQVYNDLPRNSYGRLLLPNLVAGGSIELALRLKVPARAQETDILFVRLAWDNPQEGGRQVLRTVLTLPVVSPEDFHQLQKNDQVADQVALQQTVRIRQEAIAQMERGDADSARDTLRRASHVAGSSLSPARAAQEALAYAQLEQLLTDRDLRGATKAAKFSSYRQRRGLQEE